MRVPNAASAVLAAATLVVVRDARASHPPDRPEVQQILVDPARSRAVALGLRFGGYILGNEDAGSWSSVCPSALGYEDVETYPGVALADGTVVVSMGAAGIARSRDATGCDWAAWQADFPAFFADLRAAPNEASRLFALSSSADGASFATELWTSTDGGGSWQPVGARYVSDVVATSFAIPSSRAARWYIAGSASTGAELLRSDDAASSFRRMRLEYAGVPRVIGVGGSAEDIVIVRLDAHQHDAVGSTLSDRILVSYDAGEHFESLFIAGGDLTAATLSDDGRLAFGGPDDGFWTTALPRAQLIRLELPERSTPQALVWSGSRLYAGIRAPSGALSLVVSDDGGSSFAPLMSLCDALTPLACPDGSGVATTCTGDSAAQVSLSSEAQPWCSSPPGVAPPAAPPPVSAGAREADDGSGCSVGSERRAPSAWLALIAALTLAICRRPRSGRLVRITSPRPQLKS